MFHSLGSALAGFVAPAAAIVLFTVLVRLLMHPLTRSAVRAEKAKTALAPEVRKLREKHGKDVVKLQEATTKLYRDSGTSLFAGFLPMFAQVPFFMIMYRLVTTPNPLLDSTFLGAPLGPRGGTARATRRCSSGCSRRSRWSPTAACAGPRGRPNATRYRRPR